MNRLSVVIPTLNEEQYVGDLLSSLASAVDTPLLELIISDGSSMDSTLARAREFSSRFDSFQVVVGEANVARQRNAGAHLATGEVILFLDADVVVPAQTLALLHAWTPPSGSFVMSFRHLIAGGGSWVDRAGLKVIDSLMFVARSVRLPVTSGDALAVDAKTFSTIAGFREDLLIGEDTDFGLRARRAGAKALVSSAAVIASDRRVRESGRRRLLLIWSYAYIRGVLGHPILRSRSRIHYPFGHYEK